MIQKQLNKYTTMTIDNDGITIETVKIINAKNIKDFKRLSWRSYFNKNKKLFHYGTNVCEHCDDMDDVKYMNEANACLCFNCREAVGLEIIADEQWEDTKRSLMGVI